MRLFCWGGLHSSIRFVFKLKDRNSAIKHQIVAILILARRSQRGCISHAMEQYDGYKVYRPPFSVRIGNISKDMAFLYTWEFRDAMVSGCKQFLEGQVPDHPPDGYTMIHEGFAYSFVWPAVNATDGLERVSWVVVRGGKMLLNMNGIQERPFNH